MLIKHTAIEYTEYVEQSPIGEKRPKNACMGKRGTTQSWSCPPPKTRDEHC
jgi:hypothetical protein